ncbi:TetR/AcrR family transcriptional regulator [Floccifex sp.]|uniref:TetR/AcrR family transcriptional regulator n=1 Tax=Floccifex sp. TaxID=2815810 RepID=UPI002A7567E5|nr:TetR/AcrR family transcriptional regulator [Floccifex sp.]MDD7280381.1 TetR/AcrR family transcriptional regulator [Erysipelotrichaceae bacterium]MDY2957956.1 TetR/AcrR family transcriptional regulator [Floccifex sp.]
MKNNNRKQEIIESCIHLICEKGLDLSSMQMIADGVGISKATLYFYFDSKEALFKEVYHYCHQLDVEACNAGLENIDSAIECLCVRFDNIVNYCINHPLEAKVEVLYSSNPNTSSLIERDDFIRDITSILKQGIEKKEIKDMPEWLLAEFYYGMTKSMYMKFMNNPDLWQVEEIRNNCYEIIRDTFGNKKTKGG